MNMRLPAVHKYYIFEASFKSIVMKILKHIAIAALAIYLLTIIARSSNPVEVIPGGLNPVGQMENTNGPAETAYSTNGLVGFNGFSVL